jgi:hypothetical protein
VELQADSCGAIHHGRLNIPARDRFDAGMNPAVEYEQGGVVIRSCSGVRPGPLDRGLAHEGSFFCSNAQLMGDDVLIRLVPLE